MSSADTKKRLFAAYALLAEETTTREKFTHVYSLIHGINTQLDMALDRSNQALSTVDKIQDGDVISLSAERLPENTEEEKKRKKYLLLFIKSWKDLQGEVARVQQELQHSSQSSGGQASTWGRIFSHAKGPLGAATIVAIGLVALQQTSVQVEIHNKGCGTMHPGGSIPSIPGFSLPKEPIVNGASATMTIPPFALHVDGTQKGMLSLTALQYAFTFELPNSIKEVSLDGADLLGVETEVRLSETNQHTLVLRCI